MLLLVAPLPLHNNPESSDPLYALFYKFGDFKLLIRLFLCFNRDWESPLSGSAFSENLSINLVPSSPLKMMDLIGCDAFGALFSLRKVLV